MEQQLTNEEIARVFGMYLGQQVQYAATLGDKTQIDIGTLIGLNVQEEFLYVKHQFNNLFSEATFDDKLLLRSLSAITDEHKLSLFAMGYTECRGERMQILPVEEWTTMYWEQREQLIIWGYAVPLFFGVDHWANGKTAIELGIGIDKTKSV